MRHYHVNSKEFVVGAAVGSLLGSAAALLIAPQSGKRFRQGICDACLSLADKTGRKSRFFKNFGHQKNDWSTTARSAFDGAAKCIKCLKGWCSEEEGEEEERCTKDLFIGGLVGGILGAVAGLLLAPKAGEDLRQDIRDTYEDVSEKTHDFANGMARKGKSFAKTARSRANKWIDVANHLVDDLTENSSESTDELVDKAKGLFRDTRIHDAIDWASLGVRLWHGLRSRS